MATKVLADAIGRGLHSARPSDNSSNALTGTIGRLYYETDTNQLYRDNGTTWQRVILKLGDSGDYFGLSEADGDILLKVTGGWANSPKDQVAVSAWGAAEADVDLGTHELVNVADPTFAQSAATKAYVDAAILVVPDNLTDLDPADGDVDLGTHKLVNVVDPTSNQDAATKKYVDDNVGGGGGGLAPREWIHFHFMSVAVAGGDVNRGQDGSQFFGFIANQDPFADADSFTFEVSLRAGDYTLEVYGKKGDSYGLLDMRLGAIDVALGVDFYSATDDADQVITQTDFTVTEDGGQVFTCTVNGKNGGSSDYKIPITYIACKPRYA